MRLREKRKEPKAAYMRLQKSRNCDKSTFLSLSLKSLLFWAHTSGELLTVTGSEFQIFTTLFEKKFLKISVCVWLTKSFRLWPLVECVEGARVKNLSLSISFSP